MKHLLLIIFCFTVVIADAQKQEMMADKTADQTLKGKQKRAFKKGNILMNRANRIYQNLGYSVAHDVLNKVEEDLLKEESWVELANSYRLNHKTNRAEYYYSRLVQLHPKPEYILRYAQALQANGKCKDALRWFNTFKESGEEMTEDWDFQTDCVESFAYAWHPEVSVKNFEALNSKYLDFAPIPFKDDLIITSNRKWRSALKRKDLWTKNDFSDMFLAKTKGENEVTDIKLLRGELSNKFHDGVIAVYPDNATILFTRNDATGKNSKGEVDLKIYKTKIEDGRWGEATPLSINKPDFSFAHPALSPDGQALVFASNFEEGMGEMDLYISYMKNGVWTEPKGLGPEINSPGNELFPFWSNDGTLFFSSEGHEGLGGLDVFAIQYTNFENSTIWQERIHLGTPINSEMDDHSFYIDKNGEKGYFASDRDGGKGSDDIYTWNAPGGLKFFKLQKAIVRNAKTGEVLVDVPVEYYVSNTLVNNSTKTIPSLFEEEQLQKSNKEGIVFLKVHPKLEFVFNINQSGFHPFSSSIKGNRFSNDDPVYLDIIPLPEVRVDSVFVEREVIKEVVKGVPLEERALIVLEDIYYDFDKFNIREDASIDLVMLYALLQKYPDMEVQLEAHTDSRGTTDYNINLSRNRVVAAKNFLVKKGIQSNRLSTDYFGEAVLRNDCADGIDCDEEAHQENRRTEVRITKFPYFPGK